MLRTNLSTRPFYNERAVGAALAAVAVLVLALTAWQVSRVVQLSRDKTELTTSMMRDRREVDDLSRRAADVRRGLDAQQLAAISVAAREANHLIEQRTFSWTALFNQLEATLPEDVMLVSVRPAFGEASTAVTLDIQARRSEDIGTFWDRLEKTGQFKDVQWTNENITDDGLHRMSMTAVYTGPRDEPAMRPASVAAAPPAPRPQEGRR